jgi:hypothetical protein
MALPNEQKVKFHTDKCKYAHLSEQEHFQEIYKRQKVRERMEKIAKYGTS